MKDFPLIKLLVNLKSRRRRADYVNGDIFRSTTALICTPHIGSDVVLMGWKAASTCEARYSYCFGGWAGAFFDQLNTSLTMSISDFAFGLGRWGSRED